MKTIVKQLTVGTFIAFLLLVGNVNAKVTEAKASSHESIETKLQREKWMTDEFIWNVNSFNFTEIGQETEANLEVENWMNSEKTWNLNSNFVKETEAGLEIETWMTNEKTWNVEKAEIEAKLAFEGWMINNSVWN